MRSRRTLILVASLLVGALAAYALFTYVSGIEAKANAGSERVRVFKIAADIPKGTFGDDAVGQGMIVPGTVSRDDLPATAITSTDDVFGLVAVTDLAANQVLVANQFVPQASTLSTFSSLLEADQVAITISLDQVRGVAGLLVPGDFVNMMVTTSGGDGGLGAVYVQPARFLFQKVRVLAIGQSRAPQPGETVPTTPDGAPATGGSSGLLTLAVPAPAAQQIASVDPGGIYLTLVPQDYQPQPLGPLDLNAPLPGETPGQVTPYGPDGMGEP